MLEAQRVKTGIQQAIGRSVPRETFRRWKRKLKIQPVQLEPGRWYYSLRDAKKLCALASELQLSKVKDIDSALETVLEILDNAY